MFLSHIDVSLLLFLLLFSSLPLSLKLNKIFKKFLKSFLILFYYFSSLEHMLIDFREREGREREGERNINWLPLVHALTWNQTGDRDMYPAQQLNLQPFSFPDDAQTTEPH